MKIPGITTEIMRSIFSKHSQLLQVTECFSVKAIRNETTNLNRIAIITGKKKMGKSAVIRNRADRRIKAALQEIYPSLEAKGYDFLIFSLPPVITVPWPTLVEQVQKSFRKIESKIITNSKSIQSNSQHRNHQRRKRDDHQENYPRTRKTNK